MIEWPVKAELPPLFTAFRRNVFLREFFPAIICLHENVGMHAPIID